MAETSRINKQQLFDQLSDALNEPDANRQVSIMKQQLFSCLNTSIDPLCAWNEAVWNELFREVARHEASVLQELDTGQLRCASELALLLLRCIMPLCLQGGSIARGLRLLAGELADMLNRLSSQQDTSAEAIRHRLLPFQDLIAQAQSWALPEELDEIARLAAGDDRLVDSLHMQDGRLMLENGTVLEPGPILSHSAYTRILLLRGDYDALGEFLSNRPEVLPDVEDCLHQLPPALQLQAIRESLRQQALRATQATQFSHVFSALLALYHSGQHEAAEGLVGELLPCKLRSGMRSLLERAQLYFAANTTAMT